MAFTLDIQGPDGGAAIVTAAPFRSFQVIWTLEGPGSIDIDLAEDQITDDWMAGTHRVVLNGDGPGFAAYVTRLAKSGTPDGESWKASGLGLQHILDWRIVRHATTVNDTLDAHVDWLLTEAQTQDHGDMSFAMGTVTGSPVTKTRNYCFGVVIGDAIRELASIGTGFDWEVDATGDINIWAPTRGVDTTLTLDPDDLVEIDVDFDTSELVTTVSAVGDPNQPFGPVHDMVRDVGAAVLFGRHEVVIDTDADRDHMEKLLDAARAELRATRGAAVRVRARWFSHEAPWALGTVWLADLVDIALPSYFGGTQQFRCTDVTLTVEAMPPRGGSQPVYIVEQGFDAHITEGEMTDGDPDA